MAARPYKPKFPSSPQAGLASRRWVLAGIAGMTFCVAVAFSGLFRHVPPALAAILTIACGWLMLLVAGPWRVMRSLHPDQRPEIAQLNEILRQVTQDDRDVSLRDLVLDRNDCLGELSHLLHDLAAEALANRRQSRLLHRRMGEDIQRETKKATAHLQRQVLTDPLTGLGNRRALEQRLDELLGIDAPSGCLVTVIAIDLDLFKEVNDTLGHEVGDRCLVFLADLLKSGLRREDCAIRLGGDEFIVLLPNQGIEVGHSTARRLAALFAQMAWPQAKLPRPTLSFGLASARSGLNVKPAEVLRQADVALYESKQGGRSTITVFGEQRGAA